LGPKNSRAVGNKATRVVVVVINIGRNRLIAQRNIIRPDFSEFSVECFILSLKTIELFTTIPNRTNIPRIELRFNEFPVKNNDITTPPKARGRVIRIITGSRNDSNCAPRKRYNRIIETEKINKIAPIYSLETE
jgi:hypothetical protein